MSIVPETMEGVTYRVMTDARADSLAIGLKGRILDREKGHQDYHVLPDLYNDLCPRYPELVVLLVPKGRQWSHTNEMRSLQGLEGDNDINHRCNGKGNRTNLSNFLLADVQVRRNKLIRTR